MDVETRRRIAVEGFAEVLPAPVLTTLDQLLPTRPWRELVPDEVLRRSAVAAHLDDRARRDLCAALSEVIGEEAADAMLEFLPPVPWHVLTAAGCTWR